MKKKFFVGNSYALLALFILMFYTSSFSQVTIKEKVELNPEGGRSDTTFMGCVYDVFDSTEVTLIFTPEDIEPGEITTMQLWIGQYEYDEDNDDIIQKTITIEPNYGSLNYLGGGEYEYAAPNETPGRYNFDSNDKL